MPKLPANWSTRFLDFLIRHRRMSHVLTLVITVASVMIASHLQLRTDFSELLPQKMPSVVAVKTALQRVGGSGLVIVGVESPNYEANRRFVEAFAKKIEPWVGSRLRYYEYRFTDIKDYGMRYGLHYMTLSQLDDLIDYLKTEVNKRIDSAFSGFLGLDDDKPATDKKSKSLEDIIQKNGGGASMGTIFKYRDAYLSARDGKIMALALRPFGSSLSVGENRQLVIDINQVIKDLNPQSFDPQMKTVLNGSVPKAVEEFESVRSDIAGTSILLVVLISIVLFLFLWSFRLIFLLGSSLIVAVAVTFAFTKFHIGYLNAQTAFLGSLVVGTGINYGVIFLARFVELRREKMPLKEALAKAIQGTMLPTFIAMLTTAASFLILLLATNQGLAQFGFIGSLGIFFCWVCAFLLLPLWLYELESRSKKTNLYTNPLAALLKPTGRCIGEFIVKFRGWILGLTVLSCIVSVWGVRSLAKEPLEYNFDNIKNKTSVSAETNAFRKRVDEAFPKSLTPSIVFGDNEAEARLICPEVRRLQKTLPEKINVIDSCESYYDLLPAPSGDLSVRVKKFREIHKLLGDPRLKYSSQAELLNQMREKMSDTPPTEKDLPEQILRRFREKDGHLGLFATIYPNNAKPTTDARNLLNFTDSLSPIVLSQIGQTAQPAGDSFILADLLRDIKKEGPSLTIFAFVVVFFIAVALTGGFKNGLIMAGCLALATWWMLAMQGMFGFKYNFFNFIALPLTFGIGIDYPVNVFLRVREERFRHYGNIFSTTGMAVLLCSLTTFIGYYTLMGASSQALAGFGKIAAIGEFCCLTTALVVMPAMLRFKKSDKLAS